jgi:hypothetical protein
MGLLSWLASGNDGELAKSQYKGRESASAKAARRRQQNYRRTVTKAARKGQAWEDRDRQQDRRAVDGKWYRPAR